MKKIICCIIVAFSLTFAGTAYPFSPVVRAALIGFSDFHKVGDNLYFESNLNKTEQESIITLLYAAKARISKTFGEPIAEPTIIVVGSAKTANDYGLHDVPGKFFFTPWGNYLVLNQTQLSLDVTAHELVHAEIAQRLGYVSRFRDIPTWFDEGVALQVDFRSHYMFDCVTFNKVEIERVKRLDNPSQFWSKDKDQNIKNYQAAKAAVCELFKRISPSSLYDYLKKIRQGANFYDVFEVKN